MDITINDLSFRAKPGKNILKLVNREFNNDKTRLDKYVRLFEDTFDSNLDKETIIDINRSRNFIFSNNNFQGVRFQHRFKMKETSTPAKALINECSRTFGEGENNLFKTIISKYLNGNTDFSELKQMAEKIFNPKSKKSFLEKIEIAERIQKELPEPRYSLEEFDYVQNIIMQEEAETPGTKLYNLVNNLDKLELDFSF